MHFSWTALTVRGTAQPDETAVGTGGGSSEILIKILEVKSSIHFLTSLTGSSLHFNFEAIAFQAKKGVKVWSIVNLLHPCNKLNVLSNADTRKEIYIW